MPDTKKCSAGQARHSFHHVLGTMVLSCTTHDAAPPDVTQAHNIAYPAPRGHGHMLMHDSMHLGSLAAVAFHLVCSPFHLALTHLPSAYTCQRVKWRRCDRGATSPWLPQSLIVVLNYNHLCSPLPSSPFPPVASSHPVLLPGFKEVLVSNPNPTPVAGDGPQGEAVDGWHLQR